MAIEASVQLIENSNFLNIECEREDNEDKLDILFVDDKEEPETYNCYELDV